MISLIKVMFHNKISTVFFDLKPLLFLFKHQKFIP